MFLTATVADHIYVADTDTSVVADEFFQNFRRNVNLTYSSRKEAGFSVLQRWLEAEVDRREEVQNSALKCSLIRFFFYASVTFGACSLKVQLIRVPKCLSDNSLVESFVFVVARKCIL